MEEQHSRVTVGDCCLECGTDIFECRVTDGDGVDHWHECKCGCACVDCRMPMTYQERDTSSGIEYRSYRCPKCGREGCVRAGVAMWKALSQANEPKPQPSYATPRWLTYDDVDGPKVVRLTPGEWVVGRDPECAIVVRDFGCSRRHAKLLVEAEGVRIVDLKSKGGTQVGKRPVIEARLENGDEVRLGSVLFRFVEGPAPPIPTTGRADEPGPGPKPRCGLAKLTAALERPPGSLREQTRLGELAANLGASLYAVHRVSAAFKVELPWERLILIDTVGELLDLIEQAGGTLSEHDGS